MNSYIYVYIVLLLYVYIIFCSIIYISSMEIIYKYHDKRIIKLKKTFGSTIMLLLCRVRNGEKISKEAIDDIMKKLKYRVYRRTFNSIIIDFNNENDENIKYTKIFMLYFEDYILILLNIYKRTEVVRKTNIIYMIGNFGVNKEYINLFLLKKLQSKSFYIRFNTLSSIALIGDTDTLVRAIIYMSENEIHLNNKLFTDIINQYTGDINIFNEQLLVNFKNLNSRIKCIIIDHFKYRKYRDIAEELLDLLSDKKSNKDLKASIARYFITINYKKAEKTLIALLTGRQWEVRAVCARTLGRYINEDVELALINALSDKNWNVRFNSAVSLLENSVSPTIIQKIIDKNDQNAKDIISYVLVHKKVVNYSSYLEKLNIEGG